MLASTVMILLYAVLVVSTVALLWAACACYLRIRRHWRGECVRHRAPEVQREGDISLSDSMELG
jgi:hypothetical protein